MHVKKYRDCGDYHYEFEESEIDFEDIIQPDPYYPIYTAINY